MSDEKITFLNMATSLQASRGYKEGWIYAVFKLRFGEWPNDLFKQRTPAEPTPEFLAWIDGKQKEWLDKQGKQLVAEEQAKLRELQRRVPRKGKTAQELALKFGITERTVQRYTSVPRDEYLAQHAISRTKPWEALGISRATWYRRGKPTAPIEQGTQ